MPVMSLQYPKGTPSALKVVLSCNLSGKRLETVVWEGKKFRTLFLSSAFKSIDHWSGKWELCSYIKTLFITELNSLTVTEQSGSSLDLTEVMHCLYKLLFPLIECSLTKPCHDDGMTLDISSLTYNLYGQSCQVY